MGLKALPNIVDLQFIKVEQSGAIQVGNSRVLLELVINSFLDGASPETIVQRYDTLSLSDVYLTLGYYLKHKQEIDSYLQEREKVATSVKENLSHIQPDLSIIRSRLLSEKSSKIV